MTKAKKLHWTQRPENRDKMLQVQRSAIAAKMVRKVKPNIKKVKLSKLRVVTKANVLMERYNALKAEAMDRLTEINKEVHRLEQERSSIYEVFPDIIPAQPLEREG